MGVPSSPREFIHIGVFGLNRLPEAMPLINPVTNPIICRGSGPSLTQRMKTKSGRVKPDACQVLIRNAFLIVILLIDLSWETNLKQFFAREMGLKMKSLEPEGMKNVQGTS